MTLEKYTQEVFDYMCKKLPDVNQAVLYEVAEFFVLKSNNFAYDMIAENNTRWLKEFERYNKQWDRLVEKVYK
jgi:hypothetical protein